MTLETLPIYYQLLLTGIDADNQTKIDKKLEDFMELNQEITIKTLAQTLLELRSKDSDFREKGITRYLSFKFSVQLNLLNEWHRIQSIATEEDYYNYFTALSLTIAESYQQSIATIESILEQEKFRKPEILTFFNLLFLFDCKNLRLMNFILLERFEKSRFELYQLYSLINLIPAEYKEGLFSSVYWEAKSKELLLEIIAGDEKKINKLIASFEKDRSKIKDYFTLGMITNLIGTYFFNRRNFKESESIFSQSIKFFQALGNDNLLYYHFHSLIILKIQQGDLISVIDTFEAHKDIFQSEFDNQENLQLAIIIIRIYTALNDTKSAKQIINWLRSHKKYLYKVNSLNYWMTLHQIAVSYKDSDLMQISNQKLDTFLIANNEIGPDIIELYNVRKTALVNMAKGDFERARLIISTKRDVLVTQLDLEPLFDLDIDYITILSHQFILTSHEHLFHEINEKLNDIMVYIKSIGFIEPEIILDQARIFLLLANKDFDKAEALIKHNLDLIAEFSNNKFISKLGSSLEKLSTNISNFKNNVYVLLLTELNKLDLVKAFGTPDLFVPTNDKFIEEIWLSYCIKVVLLHLEVIKVQRLVKFDSKKVISYVPFTAFARSF